MGVEGLVLVVVRGRVGGWILRAILLTERDRS
jgi:hypothetical protein